MIVGGEWTASVRLREISQPWVVDRRAVLITEGSSENELTLSLKPVHEGPLAIEITQFNGAFQLFIGDYLPSFEMNPADLRDQKEFEEIALAALEGRVRVEISHTLVGDRARRLLWGSSQWRFAQELGLSMIGLGKREIEFPAYRDPARA
jgi:hypothetical protein